MESVNIPFFRYFQDILIEILCKTEVQPPRDGQFLHVSSEQNIYWLYNDILDICKVFHQCVCGGVVGSDISKWKVFDSTNKSTLSGCDNYRDFRVQISPRLQMCSIICVVAHATENEDGIRNEEKSL